MIPNFKTQSAFRCGEEHSISKLGNSETKLKSEILFGSKLNRSEQIVLNCTVDIWLNVCMFSKIARNKTKAAMKL
jgi:hypothetical protein